MGTSLKTQVDHNVVHGKFLDFVNVPTQNRPLSPLSLSMPDGKALHNVMYMFVEHKIVKVSASADHGFISNVFPTIKKRWFSYTQ